MAYLYCKKCKKGTSHVNLSKSGFFTQLAVAVIANFSVSLIEYEFECCECGTKRDL